MKTFTNNGTSAYDIVHMIGEKDDYTITESNGSLSYENSDRKYIITDVEEMGFKNQNGIAKVKWADEFSPFNVKANCQAWYDDGYTTSGNFNIDVSGTTKALYCEMDNGGWFRLENSITSGERTSILSDAGYSSTSCVECNGTWPKKFRIGSSGAALAIDVLNYREGLPAGVNHFNLTEMKTPSSTNVLKGYYLWSQYDRKYIRSESDSAIEGSQDTYIYVR